MFKVLKALIHFNLVFYIILLHIFMCMRFTSWVYCFLQYYIFTISDWKSTVNFLQKKTLILRRLYWKKHRLNKIIYNMQFCKKKNMCLILHYYSIVYKTISLFSRSTTCFHLNIPFWRKVQMLICWTLLSFICSANLTT